MAASRWGNADREKPTFKDFQCQVGDRNVSDAEATEISTVPSSRTHKKIPACVHGRDFDRSQTT